MNCKLCEKYVGEVGDPPTAATGVCSDCRSRLGIIPMPPARRLLKPCRQCNAMRFIRVIPRELSATGGDYVQAHAGPMTATIRPDTAPKMLFAGKNVGTPTPSSGIGLLELYICTGCGLSEWYCHDPDRIPIGPEYMTELIDLESSSPYRG